MTAPEIGGLAMVVLLALIALRTPIGVAMLAVGIGGYAALRGWAPVLAYLKTAPYAAFSSHGLSVIPLFLLMGQFATRAGMSRELFAAANAWLGHNRGGIAMAAVGACGGFGAICGSSLATAATMAHVALPEMRRYHYSDRLATGSLAAGGTLGILIPPSVILVIYAIQTEQNIATLFLAALVPGILAGLGYLATIAVVVRLNPEAGPAGPRANWRAKITSLAAVWPVLTLFLIVLGGIYVGVFTPTEAAAIGAAGTGALALVRGRLDWRGLVSCLKGTASATGMIFLILLGAAVLNTFLAQTQLPRIIATAVAESGQAPLVIVVALLAIYLVLGCILDSLSMILLTIPFFFPIVQGLDVGLSPDETAIWFGVLALVVVEVGLITPPVGMNVYVINRIARDVPLAESFKGVLPFVAADLIRVGLLVAFPILALGLVRLI